MSGCLGGWVWAGRCAGEWVVGSMGEWAGRKSKAADELRLADRVSLLIEFVCLYVCVFALFRVKGS